MRALMSNPPGQVAELECALADERQTVSAKLAELAQARSEIAVLMRALEVRVNELGLGAPHGAPQGCATVSMRPECFAPVSAASVCDSLLACSPTSCQ